ncbi:hypothetical protein [Lentibacillus sediminis]|uniref:hypothetical protein n=1 Tax=Lentibacillus sediminis TaxID=1940529 RepID=UPI000C1BB2BC|nr:hypothetical protein [Lentibacillus sediminis]
MIHSVITIGVILTAVIAVLSLFLAKAMSKDSRIGYYPSLYVGFVGILLILTGSIVGKVDIMGAGLGGWGIACMFAAAVGMIITSIFDAYANSEA